MQEELNRRRQEVLMKTNEVKEKIIREEAGDVVKPIRKRTRKEADLEGDFIDDQGNRVGREGGAAKRARGDGARKERKNARRRRREERIEQGLPVSSGEENDEPEAGSSERMPRRTKEQEYDRKGRRLKSAAFVESDMDTSTSSESDDADGDDKKS